MTSLIRPEPGKSTAMPLNVSYRVGRIADVVKGRWLDLGCADRGYTAEVIGVDAEEDRIAQAAARNLPHASFQVAQSRGFIWPVLEMYPWLPKSLRDAYQDHIRFFDQTPGLRRFGVSTLVIACRNGQPQEAGSSSG